MSQNGTATSPGLVIFIALIDIFPFFFSKAQKKVPVPGKEQKKAIFLHCLPHNINAGILEKVSLDEGYTFFNFLFLFFFLLLMTSRNGIYSH